MRASTVISAVLCLAITGAAAGQGGGVSTKAKETKNDDELPDVGLQIPEETRPEIKALIKAQVLALSSRKPSERVKAAQVLGELGEQGKPVRGLLCNALLDRSPTVRVAAADALKNIDPKIQFLAVKFLNMESRNERMELLKQFQRLKQDGEPLLPLVIHSAKSSILAELNGSLSLGEEITTLSYIAKNDLATCKLIASALDNQFSNVRYSAVQSLARMKHGRRYVPKIIKQLKADTPEIRLAAIQALTALVDKSTEEDVIEAIGSQRYHPEENVRKAVEVALNKLQNTTAP